ncbi:uncharacterized protein [Watersipora subatra]|uniref:uncharacterized protein n=1 Tax=Watersipora subatra TaxID=2589382 RepID=UPI00355C6791
MCDGRSTNTKHFIGNLRNKMSENDKPSLLSASTDSSGLTLSLDGPTTGSLVSGSSGGNDSFRSEQDEHIETSHALPAPLSLNPPEHNLGTIEETPPSVTSSDFSSLRRKVLAQETKKFAHIARDDVAPVNEGGTYYTQHEDGQVAGAVGVSGTRAHDERHDQFDQINFEEPKTRKSTHWAVDDGGPQSVTENQYGVQPASNQFPSSDNSGYSLPSFNNERYRPPNSSQQSSRSIHRAVDDAGPLSVTEHHGYGMQPVSSQFPLSDNSGYSLPLSSSGSDVPPNSGQQLVNSDVPRRTAVPENPLFAARDTHSHAELPLVNSDVPRRTAVLENPLSAARDAHSHAELLPPVGEVQGAEGSTMQERLSANPHMEPQVSTNQHQRWNRRDLKKATRNVATLTDLQRESRNGPNAESVHTNGNDPIDDLKSVIRDGIQGLPGFSKDAKDRVSEFFCTEVFSQTQEQNVRQMLLMPLESRRPERDIPEAETAEPTDPEPTYPTEPEPTEPEPIEPEPTEPEQSGPSESEPHLPQGGTSEEATQREETYREMKDASLD